MNSTYSKYCILLLTLTLFGCAKHNAGIVKQTYHDLTSHYNGLFNARETFNTQTRSLSKDREENYEEILPLYAYGSIEEIASQNSTLNTSIEKARLTIQTHQEKKKKKGYDPKAENSISNWSDDAFLLIGQSYYMQGQMDSAISCFRYITANFDESVDARSKKKIKKQKANKKKKAKAKKKENKLIDLEKEGKDIRPSKKLFQHEAAKSEALVWLTKAYISNEQYVEAEAVLTYIRADKTFLKNFDKDVEIVTGFLFLDQGNYQGATEHLTSALENLKKQKKKARLQFILGQLNELQGNNSLAADYYKQSMKANANFEMVFYAKLKLIQMSRGGSYDTKEAEKLIAKMIKDNKNRDYLDQLYYEKALIALNNEEREDAKKFLNKSIDKSTNNAKQKGISFVLLADMNYEEETYPLAQAYYDSSLTLLDSEYFDYDKVSRRSEVLTELVDHLNTITVNDSLLVLAELSPKELESYLYKNAVDIVDAEIKAEDASKRSDLIAADPASNKGDKNSWYFYSNASKNSGFKKFKQKWGELELNDDWRRSDKSADGFSVSEDSESDGEDEYFSRIDAKYDEMLAAIPNSEEEKAVLTKDITDAYYNAAVVYKIGLSNYPKSAELFIALNKKFPSNTYEPEALYQLYIIYGDLNHPNKADLVKKDLLARYPNSEFARYIKDPKTITAKSNKDQVSAYYDALFLKYQAGNYDEVISACENIDSKFTVNHLIAKFDLLKAISFGAKQLYDPYVASLEYIVDKHENTEEKDKAEEILAYLRGEDPFEIEKVIPKKIKNNLDKDTKLNSSSSKEVKKEGVDKNNGVNLKLGNKEIQLGGKTNKLKKGD